MIFAIVAIGTARSGEAKEGAVNDTLQVALTDLAAAIQGLT